MSDERILSCEEALRLLAEYLDRELDVVTDGDVTRHLERCRSCFSRAEFEKRLTQQVAALRRAEVRPEFEARVRQLVDEFPASPDAEQT